jgi:hypothetical protein
MTSRSLVAGALAGIAGLATAFARPAAGDEPDVAPTLVNVTATSTLAPGKKSYDAWYPLASRNQSRFWCEGKPDEGVGEALLLEFPRPTPVQSVTISAGVWRSEALFRANNVITGIDVIADDGRKQSVVLPDKMQAVTVAIEGGPVKSLRLQIASVKKGRMNDSCISEVTVDAGGGHRVLIGITPAHTAVLARSLAGMWHAIDACDGKTAQQYLQFPFALETVGNGDYMQTKKYKDVAAFVRACKKRELSAFEEMKADWTKMESEGPGRMTLVNDVIEWHLAIDQRAWKLTGLTDATP